MTASLAALSLAVLAILSPPVSEFYRVLCQIVQFQPFRLCLSSIILPNFSACLSAPRNLTVIYLQVSQENMCLVHNCNSQPFSNPIEWNPTLRAIPQFWPTLAESKEYDLILTISYTCKSDDHRYTCRLGLARQPRGRLGIQAPPPFV